MPRIGVLLIQLGTPDEPTPAAVRRYLREFLNDPRVIEAPRWQWWFVLNFLILPRRSRESAAKYARIWDGNNGSPLLHYTRRQVQALGSSLPSEFRVAFGMRYGNPSIEHAVEELCGTGIDRLIVLAMYPQYAAASTGSAFDRLFEVLQRRRFVPAIRIVPPFFAHRGYIEAQADLIRTELGKLTEPPQKLLFSFHGYPVEFVRRGDPYQQHVERTARELGRELALADEQWMLTYQSRFGRQVWLEPYTEDTLGALARQGIRRVLIASPGFTTDCLETIDEIGREAAEAFQHAGGEQLIRCPCLNDHPRWVHAMRELIITESRGWLDPDVGEESATPSPAVRAGEHRVGRRSHETQRQTP